MRAFADPYTFPIRTVTDSIWTRYGFLPALYGLYTDRIRSLAAPVRSLYRPLPTYTGLIPAIYGPLSTQYRLYRESIYYNGMILVLCEPYTGLYGHHTALEPIVYTPYTELYGSHTGLYGSYIGVMRTPYRLARTAYGP